MRITGTQHVFQVVAGEVMTVTIPVYTANSAVQWDQMVRNRESNLAVNPDTIWVGTWHFKASAENVKITIGRRVVRTVHLAWTDTPSQNLLMWLNVNHGGDIVLNAWIIPHDFDTKAYTMVLPGPKWHDARANYRENHHRPVDNVTGAIKFYSPSGAGPILEPAEAPAPTPEPTSPHPMYDDSLDEIRLINLVGRVVRGIKMANPDWADAHWDVLRTLDQATRPQDMLGLATLAYAFKNATGNSQPLWLDHLINLAAEEGRSYYQKHGGRS